MILNDINLEYIFCGVIETKNRIFTMFVHTSFEITQTRNLDIQ